MNKSPCSTRAAEQRRRRELRPLLHWKGLLFIARASRLYRPRLGRGPEGTGNCSSCYCTKIIISVFVRKISPFLGLIFSPFFCPAIGAEGYPKKQIQPSFLNPHFAYTSYPIFHTIPTPVFHTIPTPIFHPTPTPIFDANPIQC